MFAFLKRLFSKKKTPCFIDLSGKNLTDEEYNRIKQEQQEQAMRLLEKISRNGKESLSREEKDFLDKFSRSSYTR